MRIFAALAAGFAIVVSVPLRDAARTVHGPVVAIDGDLFTVDGVSRFLIFVSYFDGLRASPATRTADLSWLGRHGISGVRVFANWHNWCSGAPVTDGVIGPHGIVSPARLDALEEFAAAASARGLLLDLSFDHGIGTSPITIDQYKAAVASMASRLARFRNVVFDIENEYQLHSFSDADVIAVIQAVRAKGGDPSRLLAASRVDDAAAAGRTARTAGMDFVAFHDPREQGRWFTEERIGQHVADIRSGLNGVRMPIYFQEPQSFDPGPRCQPKSYDADLSHADRAIRAARARGAAAWTFHTRAGFDLSRASLVEQLTVAERKKIESLAALAGVRPL